MGWSGRECVCQQDAAGTGYKLTEGRYHAHLVGPLDVGVPELVIAHGGDEQGRQRQTGHALRDVSGIDRSPKVSDGNSSPTWARHGTVGGQESGDAPSHAAPLMGDDARVGGALDEGLPLVGPGRDVHGYAREQDAVSRPLPHKLLIKRPALLRTYTAHDHRPACLPLLRLLAPAYVLDRERTLEWGRAERERDALQSRVLIYWLVID